MTQTPIECKLCGILKSTCEGASLPCQVNPNGTFHLYGSEEEVIDKLTNQIILEGIKKACLCTGMRRRNSGLCLKCELKEMKHFCSENGPCSCHKHPCVGEDTRFNGAIDEVIRLIENER